MPRNSNEVPSLSARLIISDDFPVNLDQVYCQPAPKYLLKSIRECCERDGFFTRKSIIAWMIDPQNNTKHYKSNNIKK